MRKRPARVSPIAAPRMLRSFYDQLMAAYGPQGWWPQRKRRWR